MIMKERLPPLGRRSPSPRHRQDRQVPNDRRGREHRQQRRSRAVRLRQRPVSPLEAERDDWRQRLPDQERADGEVPDDRRGREHRQQRNGSSVQLRQRPPLKRAHFLFGTGNEVVGKLST